MSAKNKLRGNALENQVVKAFVSKGIYAKRFWGSNGESGGYHREVDVLVEPQVARTCIVGSDTQILSPLVPHLKEIKIQCKKKKKLPEWIGLSEHVDCAVIMTDYGKRYLIMELNEFIDRYLLQGDK